MKSLIQMNDIGVESIPLKLIIVVVCLALIIPTFWAGLTAFSNSQTENDLRDEINRIIFMIKQTYDGDAGTTFSLTADFQDGAFKRLDYVKIGDRIGEHGGPYRSVIRYKYHGEDVKFMIIENPNIPTTSPFNTAFELGAGKHKIITEKHVIGEVGFIVVRTLKEETEFKMADVAVYEDDISIANRNDNEAGLIICIKIRNNGNLDTSTPNAKWSSDGKIRISIIDRIVLTGEVRAVQENLTIDDIPAHGSITESIEWYPVQEGDNPQDPKLRKREITVIVDVMDIIDELTSRNNKCKREYENKPPFVRYIKALFDDEAPGIGTFVVGVDVMNTIEVNATDPDGWIRQVSFWWGDRNYPEDIANPSHFDVYPENGFTANLNMGEFKHTTHITVKAYDNAGFGGDPFNETIYMEIIPDWMGITETRAKEEGKKDFDFDVNKSVFKLVINVPDDLMEGFKGAFGNDLPFISGKNNEMSNTYQLEIELPMGADVSFRKETDLGSGILSKKLGSQMDGTASVDATIHVGMDKAIEINLTRVFDLVDDARYLVKYWEEYKEILLGVDWQGIKNPRDVNELISALADAYNEVKDRPEFSDMKGRIDDIKETVEYYKDCYDQIEDLWVSIMNYKENPESLLRLMSFEASVQINMSKDFDFDLFKARYPIFPPFIEVRVDVSAYLHPSFTVSAGLEGDLTGLEFGYVNVGSNVVAGLSLSAEVDVGVNFGVAGGGIYGRITGNPELDLNAGMSYSTATGFNPYFDGAFSVILWADLGAYADFLGWRKEWEFWNDEYTLGEWKFDLVGGTTTSLSDPDKCDQDASKLLNTPGNISLPIGPVIASDDSGNVIKVWSYDFNQNPNKPNYEMTYTKGIIFKKLTSNIKIEAEPTAIYNSTGYAFIVWTQCADNQDLTSTTLNMNDFLQDSEIYYAILKGINVLKGPATLYTPNSKPDFQPSLVANSDGKVTVSWIRDEDGDVLTGEDQKHYYSIWNGTAWSSPEIKLNSSSYDYDCKMADVRDGRIISTWIHDSDENLYTTDDQQIMYSLFSDGEWTSSVQLTDDNSSKKYISLGGNKEKFILVWLSKEDDFLYKIQTKMWDKGTNSWLNTETFNVSDGLIQFPQVIVTDDSTALLTWRSNYEVVNWSNPDEGWIYYSTRDLKEDSDWTEPRKIASTNAGLLDFHSALALFDNNTAIYSHTNLTGSEGNRTLVLITVPIELKPDLSVGKVLVNGGSNVMAMEGDAVQVTATISNLGDINAKNVNVSFYDGDPGSGAELIKSRILANISRLGSGEASIEWQVGQGIHDIYVVANPNDVIPEHDYNHNMGYCTVNCLPDIRIETQDITFSSNNPDEGDVVRITASVHNDGYTSADNVQVMFYDGDPKEGGTLITTDIIGSVEIDQLGEAVGVWTALSGVHEIYAKVNVRADISSINNIASKTISILPDLSMGIGDLTLSKPESFENEIVRISAFVRNLGSAAAEHVLIKFYTSKIFIGYEVFDISVSEAQSIFIEWEPPVGSHLIYAMLDPGNQIDELDEVNNIQSAVLTVLPSIDLSIDFRLDEKKPGKVEVTATIPNNGNGDAFNVSIEFYHGDPEAGGSIINSTTVAHIIGYGFAEVTFEWRTSSGKKTVYAVVDGLNHISEIEEANNIKSKVVHVKGQTGERGDETIKTPQSTQSTQWSLIFALLGLIAVPVVLILFYWRRRLLY